MSSASENLRWEKLRKIPRALQLEVTNDLCMKNIRKAVGEETRLEWIEESMRDKVATVTRLFIRN